MATMNPALYWLIIGVMLFFLEIALPGFVLFFFGLGAIVTALAAWLTPVSIAWQLGLFIVTSLVSFLTLRNYIQRRFLTGSPVMDEEIEEEEDDEDVVLAVPGDRGVVSSEIDPPGEGRIKYSGTFWRATADEKIEEGEIISVVQQKDLVIHVEKV
ncbi:MAG: NfeD family protein [Desulfobulbaceae bacterium]|nr:NfeD family protein [Desulfobulbaceae bacterium]